MTRMKYPDFGNMAAHVAGAIGTLKGYGHERHASTEGLQHVLDELMRAYEMQKAQPPVIMAHASIHDYQDFGKIPPGQVIVVHDEWWLPIETAAADASGLFWLEWASDLIDQTMPMTQLDHIHKGKRGSWGSLYRATHWHPVPDRPYPRGHENGGL